MLVLLCLVSVIIILSLWVLIVIKFRPAVRWPVVPKDGEEEVVRAFVPGETSLLPLAGDLSGNSFFGRERARKYNSDIYYIWSMWEPILVLGNPSAAQTFFKDQAKHLRQRDAGMGYVVRCMLGQCLGTQDTEWKRQRRVFDHPFRADNVNHFLPLMERSVERWLQDNLSEQSSVTAELSTLGLLPFGMFARFVYGLDMPDADIQRLLELHRLHDQVLNAGTSAFAKLFPYEFMKYLPLSNNKQLAEFERQWKDFNLRYKKKYQNQLAVLQHDSQTASCVFSQVLHKQATSNTYLSDEEFFQTLDEILFTNVEITYGALAWAVYHLAGNPNVQQQLREEIQGKTIASVHDLKELQYLDCVVKESARIQPSVSLTIPERTVKDMVLGGYSIPSGVLLIFFSSASYLYFILIASRSRPHSSPFWFWFCFFFFFFFLRTLDAS
ncbi:hypothetical protein QOT17_008548 [Balamuthia mandrillaris]